MRQTLLKVLFHDLFAFRTEANVAGDDFNGWGDALYVGVGWLLIPWALLVLLWMLLKTRDEKGEPIPFAKRFPFGSLIFPAAILILVPVLGDTLPESAPIFGYGLFLCLAFVICVWEVSRRFRREGLPTEWVGDLGLWLFLAGIVGCRLFFVAQYSEFVFKGASTPGEYLFALVNLQRGGMVLYGGLILGLATFFLWCRIRKLPALYIADLVIPAVLLGIGIGRLGCLMNGCCYGDRCDLSIAILFPAGSVPFAEYAERGMLTGNEPGIWLHPTQLYSFVNAVLVYLLCVTYYRFRARDGAVMALGIAAYAATRFGIEFLRNDEGGQFQTSLTISQWVSICVIIAFFAMLAWMLKNPRAKTTGPALMAELEKQAEPAPKTRRKK